MHTVVSSFPAVGFLKFLLSLEQTWVVSEKRVAWIRFLQHEVYKVDALSAVAF